MGGKSHRARTAGVRTVDFPMSDSHEEPRKIGMLISVYPMIVDSCPLGPLSAKRSDSIKDGEKLEVRQLVHCWWSCKMVQSHWERSVSSAEW